jgi:hypothetical protein
MTATLAWLTDNALSTWIRESESVWAYPTMITLHSLGMGFLVGASAAVSLRILGVARKIPLVPFEGVFTVAYVGFWISAVSGTALFLANASKWSVHPVFLVKLALVVFAVANMWLVRRYVFRRRMAPDAAAATGQARLLAATSLAAWAAAITAGRLTAYLNVWSDVFKLFSTKG